MSKRAVSPPLDDLEPRRSRRRRIVRFEKKAATVADLQDVLIRVRVRDDGSCWLYAFLAGLQINGKKVLQHGKRAPFAPTFRKDPTKRDRTLDAVVRQRLWDCHRDREGFDLEDVLTTPVYEKKAGCTCKGSYGGEEHYLGLASEFNVDIAYWDEQESEATTVKVFTSDDLRTVSVEELLNTTNEGGTLDYEAARPLVYVAWSRDLESHVEAYVRKRLVYIETPAWLTSALP